MLISRKEKRAMWTPLKAIDDIFNRLNNWTSDDQETETTTVVPPVPETPKPTAQEATIVVNVPDDAITVDANNPSPGNTQPVQAVQGVQTITVANNEHTERFRKIIDSFDEDKQEPIEWVLRKAINAFCYISPFTVAVFIGMGIGDAFALGQTGWSNAGIHLLSLFLEVLMPILGISTNIMFKRALKDRQAIAGFSAIALFFLVVSTGNALALLVLLEKDVNMSAVSTPQLIAIIVRSFGSLILDVGCTIYLAISTVKSLKKYIADQRKKIEAVRDVNAVELDLENANLKAAMDRMIAVSEMNGKQRRMASFDEAERLTQDAVLQGMREKLIDKPTDRGGRSRYGSNW